MKTLVLENYCEIDLSEKMRKFMEQPEFPNVELWTLFNQAFWPENEEATGKRLMALEDNDIILTEHQFVDFQQLELMTQFLLAFNCAGKKLKVYIYNYSLEEIFNDYLNKYESDICPDTKEFLDSPDLREAFKKQMNELFIRALHNNEVYKIIRPGRPADLIKPIDVVDFETRTIGDYEYIVPDRYIPLVEGDMIIDEYGKIGKFTDLSKFGLGHSEHFRKIVITSDPGGMGIVPVMVKGWFDDHSKNREEILKMIK